MSIAKPLKVGCFACGSTNIEFRHEPGGYMQTYPSGGVFVTCDCGLTISLPFESSRGTGESERFKSLMVWLVRAGMKRDVPPSEDKLDKLLAIIEMEPPAAVKCSCGGLPAAKWKGELLMVECSSCGGNSFVIHAGRGPSETAVEAIARVQGWWRMWNRQVATGSIS